MGAIALLVTLRTVTLTLTPRPLGFPSGILRGRVLRPSIDGFLVGVLLIVAVAPMLLVECWTGLYQ